MILTFALNTVAFIAILAPTTIRSNRINAFSIFMARMQTGQTFIEFSAVEFIDATKPRQTIAHIWSNRIFTNRIQVAMISELTTLLCALINIYNWTFHVNVCFFFFFFLCIFAIWFYLHTCTIEAISLEARTTGTWIFCI